MKKRICALLLSALAIPALAAEATRAPANQAVTAGNDFSFDLYKQLARKEQGKNLFFSPYSIASALAVVAEGARDKTADEMGKALRFPQAVRRAGGDAADRPWDVEPIHAGFAALNKRFEAAAAPPTKEVVEKLASLRKALAAANEELNRKQDFPTLSKAQKIAAQINELQKQTERYELRVANALWGEKTYPFKQAFLDTINKHYRTGGAYPVDFRGNHEAARTQINEWVEKQTNKRIKNLIPEKALNELTRLVVTNAVYFKGEWSEPFPAGATKNQPFTLADGKKVQAALMERGDMKEARYGAFNKDGTFFATPDRRPLDRINLADYYPDKDGFEMADLPYKGGDVSMVVIVPRSADGLPAAEKMLTAANVQGWIGKLRQRRVNVVLPKFRLETDYSLQKPLEALGMKSAFRVPGGKDGARFDGMTDSKSGADALSITKVLHKAFVEVSEKGTEAAAATAVILGAGSGPPVTVPFTPTFRADRPFVFLIRERQTGAVLFLGRVTAPQG